MSSEQRGERAHLLKAADVRVLVAGEVQARLLRCDGRVAVDQQAAVVHQARQWKPAAVQTPWFRVSERQAGLRGGYV